MAKLFIGRKLNEDNWYQVLKELNHAAKEYKYDIIHDGVMIANEKRICVYKHPSQKLRENQLDSNTLPSPNQQYILIQWEDEDYGIDEEIILGPDDIVAKYDGATFVITLINKFTNKEYKSYTCIPCE